MRIGDLPCRMGSLFGPHPGLLPQEKVVRTASGGVQEGRRKNAECRIGWRLEIGRWAAGSGPGGNRGNRGEQGGSRSIEPNPTKSNQIRPNPTKKNGPARIKAQAP